MMNAAFKRVSQQWSERVFFMSRTEKVELTNMCLLQTGDEILVEDRKKKVWPGITFPGGHVEAHEAFHQAMIREFFEETGLTLQDPKLCGVKQFFYEDVRYIVLLYKATKFSGELRSSDEGRVFWIKQDELLEHKLAVTFDEMYRVFVDDELSEIYQTIDEIKLF